MQEIERFRPLLPSRSLSREIDHLFGDFFPKWLEENGEMESLAVWKPRLDMTENDNEFTVRMDLPGIDKDNVEINVEDHQLTIKGERLEETKDEKENYLRMERSYGRFFRSIPLPMNADPTAVKADFKNGEMKIHIPKVAGSRPRKIAIQ